MIRIGEIIKAKRKERNLTQVELAGILGVSKAAISKWENRECYPDITFLPQLAKTFNITIDELFGYSKENNPVQITNEYNFGFSLSDFDMAILDHGTVKTCQLVKSECNGKWEVRVHFISTEDNMPYIIQKYMKTNILIDGYSVRLSDGKPIVDDKPNKYYICKEKVWEYNTADHKYLKQMLLEQVAMGFIEDDD